MKANVKKTLALLLTLVLLLGAVPGGFWQVIASAAEQRVYILDATTDAPAVKPGSKTDGETMVLGTDGYFTLIFAAKTKIDGSDKDFDDGYHAEQRINFQAKTDLEMGMAPSIEFTTAGPATIKMWWVAGGDDRQMGVYDGQGNLLSQTAEDSIKNFLYISELSVPEAGFYYLGVPQGSNYIFKIEVTETVEQTQPLQRSPWEQVEAPVITAAKRDSSGNMRVTVDAEVGAEGGDELLVFMMDAQGNEIASRRSSLRKGEHTLKFQPEQTGVYSFRAVLRRAGEEDKNTAQNFEAQFFLPLKTPSIVSATSKGSGTVELVWTAISETEHYEIYSDEQLLATTQETTCLVEGLEVGREYVLTVRACRGEDFATSEAVKVTVTEDALYTWGFTRYGPSTNDEKNGYVGNLNEDGAVTVYSENGKGKIVEGGADGLSFYYTAIPTTMNFTLRAKVTVDSWKLSNGQEGFGLLVTDQLGQHGYTGNVWNNQYMAAAGKVEYYYDFENEEAWGKNELSGTDGFARYSMKLGLGVLAETGVTPDNLPLIEAGDSEVIKNQFLYSSYPLEWNAALRGVPGGTYSVIGNYTSEPAGNLEKVQLTEFILEIQKNNTGYFITYYDADGKILAQKKFYDPEALSQLDPDYVYAGFFAARNARATFSDVSLTTIEKEKDAPAEEKPVEKVTPVVVIGSGTVSQSTAYELVFLSNVAGTASIRINDKITDLTDLYVKAEERFILTVDIDPDAITRIEVLVKPDPDQDLGEGRVLSGLGTVSAIIEVTHTSLFEHRENLYVSPDGYSTGDGSLAKPLDIYTAVDVARPGQTIVLLEGTYLLERSVKIQRGMNGTAEKPIRMVADPNAKSRPVLDFQGLSTGIVHLGNHWFFYGFDVTRSLDGQKGFQVSGNYNVLDRIETYYNGNTGIQISRNSSTFEPNIEYWPSHNLILNCTSYCNYDIGFEDADGFAAKLTCGEGNVFDGCVAYNNADDGWDLYTKVRDGQIGAVTIRNCVAYGNGFVPGVEGQGNGNGFKMGGEGISGKHVLENCIAFWNLNKGIDANHCPDITVINCTSFNNGSHNVALFTNYASNTAFVAKGIISFKNGEYAGGPEDNLKPKGSQNEADYKNASCYYWNGTASLNTAGGEVTANMFQSTDFQGIVRNADGTINMQGFLTLTDAAPADAGARMAGEASAVVTLNNPDQPPQTDDPVVEPTQPTVPNGNQTEEPAPFNPTVLILVAVAVVAIAAVVVVYLKKRK